MARLKFLLFALVALGLWAMHLTMVAPLAVGSSVELANAAVAGAGAPVAVALEAQRSLVQAIALKVASGTALLNPGPKPGAKPEAPTVDRFATVRAAAAEILPAEAKEQVFVALVNDVGVLWARGTGEPATAAPEGLDLPGVVQGGAAGSVRTLDNVPYLLLPLPLLISDKNEVRGSGSAVVGLPLLPDVKVLEAAQKSLGLTTLSLVSDGKPLVTAGDGAPIAQALKAKPGELAALESGPVRELGPLQLPLFASQVQSVSARQALTGSAFEVVAVASSRAALASLAGYQVFGLGGLVGLLFLALAFTLLMGGGEDEGGAAMVLPPPLPAPPVSAPRREDSAPPVAAALSMPEPPPAEASPDDFDFPPSSPSTMQPALQSSPSSFAISSPSQYAPPPPAATGQAPAYQPEPASDPFAQAAPPPPPPPQHRPGPPIATAQAPAFKSPPAPAMLNDEDEGARTVAYPAFKPPMGQAGPPPMAMADPFAMAAAQEPHDGNIPGHGADNPDATRVAAIPTELLKQSRSGSSGATGERPALKAAAPSMPKVASLPPVGGGANDEERHFQEVFRDFVATREKCREPADGLTFDKFKAKLLKNKEQLVAKYACRTVRFQVYVKDGKAALKATPVKD